MRAQFYQNQLSTLKRANVSRKLKLANKAGYEDVENYQVALENSISEALYWENIQSIAPISAKPMYSKSIL